MARRALVSSMAALLVVAALFAPAASGAQPTFERITIDETFADEFLTAVCGFPVVTQAKGHITVRTFEREGPGLVQVSTINVALTAMAGDNTFKFRDVGADVLRVTPTGELILMIVGQLPFEFTGVLKINPVTGEVIHEPQHRTEAELQEACAALGA